MTTSTVRVVLVSLAALGLVFVYSRVISVDPRSSQAADLAFVIDGLCPPMEPGCAS